MSTNANADVAVVNAAAVAAASPSLTGSWSARSRERQLLVSLLRPAPQLSPVIVAGAPGSGRRSVVLDVLTQNRSHFGYVSGLHSAATGGDKTVLRRATNQLRDRALGPAIFQQMCVAQPREEEAEEAALKAAAAAQKAKERAAAGYIDDDADEDGAAAVAAAAPSSSTGPGRKRRKLAADGVADVGGAVGEDGGPSAAALVPLHPEALVDDLTTRRADGKLVARPVLDDEQTSSLDAAAATSAAASATAASAATLSSLTHSHHRTQLLEFVRTLVDLLSAHEKQFLGSNLRAVASDALPPPPTFFLVVDHPQRLAESQPGLLSSLLDLSAHTRYPLTLVLILPSVAGGVSDGAQAVLGLDHQRLEEFVRVPFPPYTNQQQAQIVAKKLWQENRFVANTFAQGATARTNAITAAAAANSDAATASSSSSAVAASSASASAASIPPALLASQYSCWVHFVDRYLDLFHSGLVSSSLQEAEHLTRAILPRYLRAMSRRFNDHNDNSVLALTLTLTSDAAGLPSAKVDVSHLTASLMEELRADVRTLLASVFNHEESCNFASREVASSSNASKAASLKRSLSTSSTSSSSAVAAAVSSQGGGVISSGSLGLSSSLLSHGASLALNLSRTSKMLLVASFLGSYNPADKDSSRFVHARMARSNRRGKSAAMTRKGGHGAHDTAASAVSQLQLGPNACTLERLLAIFHVLVDDDGDQGGHGGGGSSAQQPSLATCYQHLNALCAAHLIEQIHTGGGGGGAARKAAGAGGDLLGSVKLRCLLSHADMETICASIHTSGGSTSGGATDASTASGSFGLARSSSSAMVSTPRFSLDAYLYDGGAHKRG